MAYHHGDLREAILRAAAEAVARDGVHALSLRSLARDVGVSHTAPRHHFGDKRGLLTALAVQGYDDLAAALRAAGPEFLQVGVAYVQWAVEHPAHYAVMFAPDLIERGDTAYLESVQRLRRTLGSAGTAGAATGPARGERISPYGRAAWSMAHGLATLALSGNFEDVATPEALGRLARETLTHLNPPARPAEHGSPDATAPTPPA